MASSVLLLPAIVSRIQKTVTVAPQAGSSLAASPLALPAPVAQAVELPPLVATTPAPAPVKKATKRRKVRVAAKAAPAVIAAPTVAKAVETESPAVLEAANVTPPEAKVLDTQADLAQIAPAKKPLKDPLDPPPPSEDSGDATVAKLDASKEDDESKAKSNAVTAAEPEVTVALSEEDKLVDNLLAEDHSANDAVDGLNAAAAKPVVDVESEVTTAQVEGEIIPTDLTSYEANLVQWKKEWKSTQTDLRAALGGELPQAKVAAAAGESPDAIADSYVERSAGPQLVTPAGEPVLVAPALPAVAATLSKESLSVAKLSPPVVAAPAENNVAAETEVSELPVPEAAPTYEVTKGEVEAPAQVKVTKEPEPAWASYRKNEKDEGDQGPTLVSPSLSAPGQLAAMAIQPKEATNAPRLGGAVTTQLASFVAPPTLVAPARAAHSVSREAIAQVASEEVAPAPSTGRVLDASEDIAALTEAAPKPVVVASITAPSPSSDVSRSNPTAMPQLTQRHLAPRKPEAQTEADEPDDSQATAEEAGALESDREDGGQGNGQLEMEPALEDWLEKNKGHVELSLVPVRGRNPNDAIHLDPDEFNFPEPEFQFSTEGLKGTYRLMAEFFAEGTTDVIAKVAYPEKITADSYKRKIPFRLSYRDFQRARFLRANKARGLSMTLTIFEGASGNYRYPRAITRRQNARVAIEGFPELGFFQANRRGNVVIPRVPSHSTLRLHVMADGFYDTHVTVPTGSSPVYAPVFLVSRDQVLAVTKHFTKRPQQKNKGVVLGRVFNPKTRTPLEGEEFGLQYRKGQTVYFYALPDLDLKQTSKTGLFGYFNVSSSPRGLKRESKPFPYLLDVAPDSAVYLELGRGGEKSLKGQLKNPYHPEIPQASIRLAGAGKDEEVYSNHRGSFEIDGLDFPTGTVRVEVEAEGMPTFLYDVAWNPRERVKTDPFTLFDKEVISSSVKTYGKQNWKSNLGTVIGGAAPDFFKGRNECITATLESLSGRTLDEKSGPFFLGTGGEPAKGDKLCLNGKRNRVTFVNLAPGPYLLKWRNATGQTIRAREVNVELKKVSVSVD